ncbi:ammonium transporter [Novosphingobium sp. KCTC 2891]|uniref:ammonium transporter n=1 Tax=Novosphingobium sp. KCTC 2891 TaxID=2989730 RepID=UPI002221659A|nr:ammonium transporter [Novosphingobium sp. KCTC 2891]MCW1381723.1 ammonium transporter [Novosphingobium sp. KCTC 2891]
MRKFLAVAAMAASLAVPMLAHAQVPTSTVDVADTGDTAWILVSSAFVLMMAAPGLTLFYGGLVRTKGFLAVMVQTGAIAAVASLLWVLVGYTLAFGEVTNGWLGGGNAWMLLHLGNVRANTQIPESAFVLFQMAFALITPALMVGAWVDRARFGWVVGFCALWSLIVYAPAAHWVWGGGWLSSRLGTLDFAGGIVVHTTAGVSALVVALLLGKRAGYPKTLMLPHSPALTMAGAALLWVGWFGFNGGSALAANDDAAAAIINTHVAACTAALAWILVERFAVGKSTSIGFATGAVAGLATVTPAAGFIAPGSAVLLGLAATAVCYPMILVIKHRLEIDDSLDVFAVHGMGGITGSILLAFLISPSLGGTGYAAGMGMARQLVAQLAGVGVVGAWSAVATVICALMVSMVVPMRVTEDEEREGLDITSHGERAWEFD